MLTVTDQFCGAGGSSLGAVGAGTELVLAMNHWPKTIDTHGHNFPEARHACVDVACVDPSWYPRTDILITSPECKAHSYARGRPKDDPSLLEPHEIGAAMAMDRHVTGKTYIVIGTKRDQVKQYGNAVTPPVMKRIIGRVAASLDE